MRSFSSLFHTSVLAYIDDQSEAKMARLIDVEIVLDEVEPNKLLWTSDID